MRTSLGTMLLLATLPLVGCAGVTETPEEELRAYAARIVAGDNEYLGRRPLLELRRQSERTDLAPGARANVLLQLALAEAREGNPGEAAKRAEEAWALVRPTVDPTSGDPRVAELLGLVHSVRAVVHLRNAETTNCVGMHSPGSCLFPIRDDGVHASKGPARQARESLEALLEARPDDLGARWLLNIVAMTLGEWPEGVAERFRIAPELFDSEVELPPMAEIAGSLGVNAFDLAGGVAVEDFDGDGRLDLLMSTSDPEGSLKFFARNDSGGFDDRTAAAGLVGQLGGLNLVAADYDGDDDTDVLVLRGAWQYDEGRIRNSLLRNDGDGSFTDVTDAAGLAAPAYPTQTAAWGDYDGDGDLDVFIGNEASGSDEDHEPLPSQLFRNDGDGTFTDIAVEAGVTNDLLAKSVAAGDYDGDGDLDLFVSNIGPNRLYRNDGGGIFTDVAAEAGVSEPSGRSFTSWFFDYDNDGRLDLWVPGYDATVADVAADLLGLPFDASPPRLYRNRGDGTFEDVAEAAGLHHAYLPMGSNFGDLDSDGWLDIYLGTGDPDFRTLMPNVMLWNDGGSRFVDVTSSTRLGHLQKGHGIAFADLDHDGDTDIYHQLGGFVRGDRFWNALFENPGSGHRFLVLRLVGDGANPSAFGARVAVTVETPAGLRTIHRTVGSVSSFGGSPTRRLEIGLGDATAIRELAVTWPGTDGPQRWAGLPLDRFLELREGDPAWLDLPY